MNKYSKPVVLMLGPLSPPTGGMETMMRELLNSDLSQRYHLVHLDNSKPAFIRRASIKYSGYHAAFLRNPFSTLYSFALSVFSLLCYLVVLFSRPVDLIHIHTASYSSFWEKLPFILAGRIFSKPVILHVHGARFDQFYQSSSISVRRLIKKILCLCNPVITLSGFWRKYFTSVIGLENVQLVENGIDISLYRNNEISKTANPTILFLGELSRRKGIDDLLKIAVIVRDSGVKAQFIAAGPGNLTELNLQLQEMGLHEIVKLSPPVFDDSKKRLLAQSWLYILPSYAEGMPVAIIEALAAGLPVIATRVGGIPDMITEKLNGFLVQPGDIELFGQYIINLIQDNNMRQMISVNNFSLAANRFDIHLLLHKIDKIYAGLFYT